MNLEKKEMKNGWLLKIIFKSVMVPEDGCQRKIKVCFMATRCHCASLECPLSHTEAHRLIAIGMRFCLNGIHIPAPKMYGITVVVPCNAVDMDWMIMCEVCALYTFKNGPGHLCFMFNRAALHNEMWSSATRAKISVLAVQCTHSSTPAFSTIKTTEWWRPPRRVQLKRITQCCNVIQHSIQWKSSTAMTKIWSGIHKTLHTREHNRRKKVVY